MSGAAEPVRRTLEIEEPSNRYLIHPIASGLTPCFAALHIHPNAISLAGMAFGVLAGVAYFHYQDPGWALAGFLLMFAWHVMDGADGQLARLTHKQSHSGKVLDGICDYVTFIAVYVGLALALSAQYGGWIWLLAAAAGACHAVQAAAYETQREEYNFWGGDRKSVALSGLGATPRQASGAPRFADLLHNLYAQVQFGVAGGTAAFHHRLAAVLKSQPERESTIRRQYREAFAPSIRRWSVLSANYRTLGIFLSAWAGAPAYYFWFEIIGFSAILAVLLLRQRTRFERFLRDMEALGANPIALSSYACCRGNR